MIKAIIFDCYGVLATDGWLPFKEKYFGSDRELFEQAGELNRQADSGFISVEDFICSIAEMAAVSEKEAKKAIDRNVPNAAIFELIKELKTKYKIGILSNSSSNALHRIFSSEQLQFFDAIALSYELGLTKPQPEAYAAITTKLCVEPDQAVFIDDQERYATAATEIGMKAIWYRDYDQMKDELEQLLKTTSF